MPDTAACVATLLVCLLGDVLCVCLFVFVQGFYQTLCDDIHDKKWGKQTCVRQLIMCSVESAKVLRHLILFGLDSLGLLCIFFLLNLIVNIML